jgi:sodium-dependent dicarboxylate transporter 2/3/5
MVDDVLRLYARHGEKNPVNFATWMGVGLPLSALLVMVVWLWLNIVYLRCR